MTSERLGTLAAFTFISLFPSLAPAQIYFSDDFENPAESAGK